QDQLYGKMLRSPHAHAKIVSIDTSKAAKLPGVKAIVTSADLPKMEDRVIDTGEGIENMKHMTDRILASSKVLFQGHPLAAVAATDPWIAEEACKLIEVKYEVLKAVTDPVEAMAEGAPLLHGTITTTTLGKKFKKDTNVCLHIRNQRGDIEAGFNAADLVIEREFRTATVHQGYIELHGCTALWRRDGQITIWTSTQGGFPARDQIATILKVPLSGVKVVPMEIGGGFGGKIPIYMEPVAAILSRKTGHPVRMVMTRAEVFHASGPTSATCTRIKIGVKNDGKITAAQAWLAYEAGAFPGDWSARAVQCVFSPYKLENLLIDSHDVMTNTTKVAAYRAPASPQAMWGVESVMDEIALKLNMDPLDLRMKNAVQEGDLRNDGLPYPKVGLKECITAAKNSDHYKSPLPKGPYAGRGLALGFWFNAGLQSSAMVTINHDGTANVVTGSVDIGGSRASMAIMTAEVLGLKAEEVRPSVGDTDSIGHTDVTGGSRTTHTTGMAVHMAATDALNQLKLRVAKLWDCQPDHVEFKDGAFHDTRGTQKPMTVRQLGPKLPATGGPVTGKGTVLPKTIAGTFGLHIADTDIDPDTGKVRILRYTVVQDVGTAIHPSYVEGQLQGGAVQGIGWALNEEYVRNDKGNMLNAGFLDYRMPTFLDVPVIETVLVEVPNPHHPFGVRGVGETPIVPPMATIHNAIARGTGYRIRELPMAPYKVLEGIRAGKQPIAAD
ncbi:MAG TPA: xanthine dehydrogenase family protein molybdopterin-binding subunit, partial [bacterium]